jgi:hypothetical protein
MPNATPDDSLELALANLGLRERAFVEAFTKDLTITAAEKAAGLAPGKGAALARNADVRSAIAQLLRARKERFADARSHVVQMLCQLAQDRDMSAIVRTGVIEPGHPKLLGPDELPPEIARCIKKVAFKNGQWEYEFVDAAHIMLQLLKHFADVDKHAAKDNTDAKSDKVTLVMFGSEDHKKALDEKPEPGQG